ncbi:MAG: PIN domain-containing protein [Crocinitomicaceae bacterium]
MEVLYIDTSIFEGNNFFESHRIQELYRLSQEEKVKVLMPELTYDEIRNRLHINVIEAHKKFNKYRTDTRVLRNVPSLNDKFNEFDLALITDEIDQLLTKKFIESKFVIIDYPQINIGNVFKKYFASEFPFSSGKKKNEFPDAFALVSVEKWAQEHKKQVILFSKDNDLLKYETPFLVINDSFEDYINDKIREDEDNKKRIEMVDEFIRSSPHDVLSIISEWTRDELYDDRHYLEFTNYHEIHNIEVGVVDSEIEGYKITQAGEDYIAVQMKVLVSFHVDLTIDDEDYMMKDDDTKEWIYLDTTVKGLDDTKYIDIDVTFYPDDKGNLDFDIEQINLGKKLKISGV